MTAGRVAADAARVLTIVRSALGVAQSGIGQALQPSQHPPSAPTQQQASQAQLSTEAQLHSHPSQSQATPQQQVPVSLEEANNEPPPNDNARASTPSPKLFAIMVLVLYRFA